jgi:hypothetical protein
LRVLSSPDTTGRGAMLAAFDRSRPKPAPTAAQTAPAHVPNDELGAPPGAPSGVAAGGAVATGAAAGTAGASGAPKVRDGVDIGSQCRRNGRGHDGRDRCDREARGGGALPPPVPRGYRRCDGAAAAGTAAATGAAT